MQTEGSRRKRKVNYMLMLFMDSKEGRIRQMGFGPVLVEVVAVIVLATIVVLAVTCYRNDKQITVLLAQTEQQQKDIEKLTEENADLISLRK